MRPSREGKPPVPGQGGYEAEHVEVAGPPDYHMPLPPTKYRGPLIPMGTGDAVPEGVPQRPAPDLRLLQSHLRSLVPLVPTEDEIKQLPRAAQVAFAARCALRVKQPATATTAADVARVLFESATIDTPLTAQLRCIRRDFARLKRLARIEKWTDETPVAPEVFGPLWPPGIEPAWATEATPGSNS